MDARLPSGARRVYGVALMPILHGKCHEVPIILASGAKWRLPAHIHAADPMLEAGHNMATAEAMAAGPPVIGSRHPTSPIRHGISGYLSNDPQRLRRYAQMLLEDQGLATLMGQQARKAVEERFSLTCFRHAFLRSIEMARRKWYTRKIDPASLPLHATTGIAAARTADHRIVAPYASMSMRPGGTRTAAVALPEGSMLPAGSAPPGDPPEPGDC